RQSRLEELAQDKTFLRELKQVFEEFEKYLGRHDTYGKTGVANAIKNPIAYFSAEFGFHESIPNYSGGLGILAGDHCKSASDPDIPENSAEDRLITAELYGGDLEMRMRQEMMLGIGGVKALAALGIQPAVFHMNEGHSAFLALERIRLNVAEKKLDFYSALQLVAA